MPKGKRNPLRFYKLVTIASVIIAVVALSMLYFSKNDVITQLIPIDELSTQGYTKVDVTVSAAENKGVVVIEGNCYRLTAATELSQVESIAKGQEGVVDFRPSTHDLFSDALGSMDINVVMVKVIDIQNNTYIGRLILKQGDRIASLDSRPSDGIAIAVRTGAPVYMKDDLLKAHGENIC